MVIGPPGGSGRGASSAHATPRPRRSSAARDAPAAARSEPRPDPSPDAEAAARSELRPAARWGARADRYPGEEAQAVAAARASRGQSAGSCGGAFHRAGPSGPSSPSPKDTSPVPPGRFERAPVSSSMLSSERPPRGSLPPPDSAVPPSGSYSLGVRRGVDVVAFSESRFVQGGGRAAMPLLARRRCCVFGALLYGTVTRRAGVPRAARAFRSGACGRRAGMCACTFRSCHRELLGGVKQ